MLALTARAECLSRDKPDEKELDAQEALTSAAGLDALLFAVPDVFELLAILGVDAERDAEAGRRSDAGDALRQRIGAVPFKVHDAAHDDAVAR